MRNFSISTHHKTTKFAVPIATATTTTTMLSMNTSNKDLYQMCDERDTNPSSSNSKAPLMLVEETKHLCGLVAKTRALFENKENLNGLTKQTSKMAAMLPKQSISVTNIYSILNSNNQSLSKESSSTKFEKMSTNDRYINNKSPIMNKTVSMNFNGIERYRLNQSLSNSSISSSTTSSQKMTEDPNNFDQIVHNNNLSEYTCSVKQKPAVSFKPVIQRLQKFQIDVNRNEQQPVAAKLPPISRESVKMDNYREQFDYKTPNVKEVKKSFETSSNSISPTMVTRNIVQHQQQQLQSVIKQRDPCEIDKHQQHMHHNHHDADSLSVTSMSSSISSFSSTNSSSLANNNTSAIGSQFKMKKRNFEICQSSIPVSVGKSTTTTTTTTTPLLHCEARQVPQCILKDDDKCLTISPKYKHKIIKLENNVCQFAKDILTSKLEDDQSQKQPLQATYQFVQSPRFSLLQKQLDNEQPSVVRQQFPRSNSLVPSTELQKQLAKAVNGNDDKPSKLPVKVVAKTDEKSNPSSKKDDNKHVDNESCVLPSKYRTRSVSLIDPKQMQVAASSNATAVANNKRDFRSATTAREALLRWCKRMTQDYTNIQISNFSSSWSNGLAFCALIHHFLPDAYDYEMLKATNCRYNFELAFKIAEEKAGIVPLLDVEDMIEMGNSPDWKCVFTYVHSIYRRFKDE